MGFKLYPPGERGFAHWSIRGRHRGQRLEYSTGKNDRADAERWRAQFEAELYRDDVPAVAKKTWSFLTALEAYKSFADPMSTATSSSAWAALRPRR